MKEWAAQKIGTAISFAGTLMLAFGIGDSPPGVYQETKGGPASFAHISHPALLFWGVALLAVGFLLDIVVSYFLQVHIVQRTIQTETGDANPSEDNHFDPLGTREEEPERVINGKKHEDDKEKH
jgi:hypothetical protein